MRQLAHKRPDTTAVEEYGTIIDTRDGAYVVVSGSGRYKATKALSCLIEPEVGDKVLFTIGFDDAVYVLAILERDASADCEVRIDGTMKFTSIRGAIKIGAREGIELTSGRHMDLFAPRVKISGQVGEILLNQLHYWGGLVDASVSRIRSVSHVVESASERLVQTVKNCYRTISESEHVKAGNLHYTVRRLFNMRGKYTMITAKKDVKINGTHIHMG